MHLEQVEMLPQRMLCTCWMGWASPMVCNGRRCCGWEVTSHTPWGGRTAAKLPLHHSLLLKGKGHLGIGARCSGDAGNRMKGGGQRPTLGLSAVPILDLGLYVAQALRLFSCLQ